MKSRLMVTSAFLMLLLLDTAPCLFAQNTIHVTFDDMGRGQAAPPGDSGQGILYVESGIGTHGRDIFIWRQSGGPGFPDSGGVYLQAAARTTEVFFDYIGSSRRFNALSVDLALYSASSLDPVTVKFTGLDYNRGYDVVIAATEFTIAPVLDAQGSPAFQTFYFPPEFNRITYLGITPGNSLWSLDNLVLSEVPEPTTLALLALGGAALFLKRRMPHLRRDHEPSAPSVRRT